MDYATVLRKRIGTEGWSLRWNVFPN